MTVKIVLLPGLPPKGDIVEWIEAKGDACEPQVMREEIEAMAAAAVEAKPTADVKKPVFEIIDLCDLIESYPEEDPAVIEGVLREAEIMNMISVSKAGKSWLVASIIIAVAFGWKCLGRFWTKQGKILLIDNELKKRTLAWRMRKILSAMGVPTGDIKGRVHTFNARGNLIELPQFIDFLNTLEPNSYVLVVLDAFYRFLPAGTDENSNAQITALFNQLDVAIQRLRAALIIVHHSSKGSQSDKAITDTGAGAGAQSRCADTHAIIRPHEDDGVYVFEAVTRSFQQPEAVCIRFNFPCWELAEDLDPSLLKQVKPRRKPQEASKPSKEEIERERYEARRLKLSKALVCFPNGETESKIAIKAGLSNQVAGPIFMDLMEAKIIEAVTIKKNKVDYPAVRLILTRSDSSDSSDKTPLNPTCPTVDGGVDRTGALSLESTVSPTSTPPCELESKSQRNLSERSRNGETNGVLL